MPLPLLVIPLIYSAGSLIATAITVGATTGVAGGFFGWFFAKNEKAKDEQRKMDEQAEERFNKAQQAVDEVAHETKKLKENLSQFDSKKDGLIDKLDEFKADVEETKGILDKNALVQVTTAITAQTTQLDEYTKEITLLKSKLTEMEKTLGEKNPDILKGETELIRLEALVKSQTETIGLLNSQVATLTKACEKVQKERDQYKRVIDEELTPKIGMLLQKVGTFGNRNVPQVVASPDLTTQTINPKY